MKTENHHRRCLGGQIPADLHDIHSTPNNKSVIAFPDLLAWRYLALKGGPRSNILDIVRKEGRGWGDLDSLGKARNKCSTMFLLSRLASAPAPFLSLSLSVTHTHCVILVGVNNISSQIAPLQLPNISNYL